jgi:uncharacterized protein
MISFELLEIGHYERLAPFFARQPCWLSAYSLGSLIAWRNADGFVVRFTVQDDAVIVLAAHKRDENQSHLTLPVPSLGWSPGRLARLCQETGYPHIWFVPDTYLATHGVAEVGALFAVVEQPEYEDYVFLTSDLAELKGKRYSKKRNLIAQFEREYVDFERVRVDPIEEKNIADCLVFLEEWCTERGCEDQEEEMLACEKKAFQCALSHFAPLGFAGIAVRIDGKIAGLGACSALCEEVGVLHFEKANANHKGLYQYLDRECARRLFAGRFVYINKESDMNLPGLRQAKTSYFPVQKIKSYLLTLRSPA